MFRLSYRALHVASLVALALPFAAGAQGVTTRTTRTTRSTSKTTTKRPAAPATHATSAGADSSVVALPAAKDLIAKYLTAIGGRDAYAKRQSMRITGTFEMAAAGIRADVTRESAAPNRMVTFMTLPGMGDIRQGFDGSVGWSINPSRGPQLLQGKELEQRASDADFYSALHESGYASMETESLTDFAGSKAYKVKTVRTNGDVAYEYFDATSGLLIGQEMTLESAMGKIPSVSTLSDYKDFGRGLLLPAKSVQRVGPGQEFQLTITSVEYDNVAPASFELPAEIKSLAKP